mgnify:CR=1 FL=1
MMRLSLYLLALLQGFFDVLPIGGASHQLLLPRLLHWPEPTPATEFAIHAGILLALAAWVWRDLFNLGIGAWHIARGRRSPRARQLLVTLLALLPFILAGIALAVYGRDWLKVTPTILGAALLGFGLLLWLGDRLGMTVRRIEHMTVGNALIIGMLLAVALVPGAGRTAMVVIACRWLGYERPAAARLSFILSVPLLIIELLVQSAALWRSQDILWAREPALAGVGALLGALLGIGLLTAWIERRSFAPFALYRILAGAGVLALVYLFHGLT